jgi:hypothetical protein
VSVTLISVSTGVPFIDSVFAEFLGVYGEVMEEYRDPSEAEGQCLSAAGIVDKWCFSRGLKAWSTTAPPDELGYSDRPSQGKYDNHCLSVIEYEGHCFTIDFTATQYGYTDLPLIQRYCRETNSFQRI